MIDDGDKLKEKRQKGGNENTEPGPLVCNLFLSLFFYFAFSILFLSSRPFMAVVLWARISFLFFFFFLIIRESELLCLLILDSH